MDKMEGILLAQGIAKGGLYKLLSQDDSDIVFKFESLSSNPSSMLPILQNKRFVNSLQKSSSLMSVSPASFHSNNLELNNSNLESFLTSIQLLHNRFGHPNKHALQTIIRKLHLHHISNQSLQLCDTCQCGKLHQFHFPVTETKSRSSLELLHTELWGPASECSMDSYKYFISFVNDFTKYSWIFPLTLKSEALDTFKHFKTLLEK